MKVIGAPVLSMMFHPKVGLFSDPGLGERMVALYVDNVSKMESKKTILIKYLMLCMYST